MRITPVWDAIFVTRYIYWCAGLVNYVGGKEEARLKGIIKVWEMVTGGEEGGEKGVIASTLAR